MIVPVGLDPPAMVALSELEPPRTRTAGEAWVVAEGEAFPTTTDSFASLQDPETGALLASPP